MSTVEDVLKKKGYQVITISEEETALQASQLIDKRKVGAIVVLSRATGNISGIISERDLVKKVVSTERIPAETLVKEVMTQPVAVCHPGTKLEECEELMHYNRIRHLPVVGNENELIGIITSGDLLADRLEEHERTVRYLEDYFLK